MPGSFQGSEADRRSASDSLESQIRSLVEMYVSETPFAPKPWVPSAVPGPSPVRGGFCSGRLQTLHSRGRVVPLQNPIYAMVYEELFGKLLAACTHARGRWWPCPLLCCFVCCFVNCRGIYTDRSYPVFCLRPGCPANKLQGSSQGSDMPAGGCLHRAGHPRPAGDAVAYCEFRARGSGRICVFYGEIRAAHEHEPVCAAAALCTSFQS